jgi:hypothetical protein
MEEKIVKGFLPSTGTIVDKLVMKQFLCSIEVTGRIVP